MHTVRPKFLWIQILYIRNNLFYRVWFETLNKENAPVEDNNKTLFEAVGDWFPFSGGKRIQHKYNRRIRNDITKKKRKSHAIKMRNKTIRRQV